MATKKNLVDMTNAIRDSSPVLRDALPVATEANIQDVGNPILTYVPVANAFLDALVNKIYLQIIRARAFRNPLAKLKKGNAPLGADIEEIHTNPVTPTAYDATAETLLKQAAPDVATIYHRLNRQDVYKLTIERADLRQAFTSWDAYGNMIDANVNALYSGNYIDEFRLMLNTLTGATTGNAIVTKTVTDVTDEASAKELVKTMRAMNRKFQLPSTEYNCYAALQTAAGVETPTPRTTWCNPEDVVVVITADTESTIDVDVLAAAFNIDRAQFIANNVIVVDSFGEDSNIVALMFDRAYIQVYDNLFIAEPFRNPETLATTYFMHVWQTYSASPFANAVAFVKAEEQEQQEQQGGET